MASRLVLVAAVAPCFAVMAPPVPAAAETVVVDVDDSGLGELSGAAISEDGAFLWTIEDSGNSAMVRATGTNGATLGEWPIDAANFDWEDLAVGPSPEGGRQLLVADIGDNRGRRETVAIYYVEEPELSWSGVTLPAYRIDVAYPDGPRDAEAILVHPGTGETLIVAKQSWGAAGIYRLVWTPEPALERVGEINGPGIGPLGQITGGAVSPDGTRAALLTYSDIAEWDIAPGQSLAEALGAPPRILSRPSIGQTEALAYGPDGSVLYVTAEGDPSRIATLPLDPER